MSQPLSTPASRLFPLNVSLAGRCGHLLLGTWALIGKSGLFVPPACPPYYRPQRVVIATLFFLKSCMLGQTFLPPPFILTYAAWQGQRSLLTQFFFASKIFEPYFWPLPRWCLDIFIPFPPDLIKSLHPLFPPPSNTLFVSATLFHPVSERDVTALDSSPPSPFF